MGGSARGRLGSCQRVGEALGFRRAVAEVRFASLPQAGGETKTRAILHAAAGTGYKPLPYSRSVRQLGCEGLPRTSSKAREEIRTHMPPLFPLRLQFQMQTFCNSTPVLSIVRSTPC